MGLLSFTNSAIDEIHARCKKHSCDDLLQFPNFVGTVDGFLRHFIVLPAAAKMLGTWPTVVDSWDTLGIELRLTGSRRFAGEGLSLDLLNPATNTIEVARIRHNGLKAHVTRYLNDYTRVANQRRNALIKSGYLSANDIRHHAQQRIAEPAWDAALGQLIAARFAEIIVDEAQDCNPGDLQILTWLRKHGIPITTVCDPDQAIYGFRHGSVSDLRTFANTYPTDDQLRLSGNFRSSTNICGLSGTFRSSGTADDAVGENAAVQIPSVLLVYRGSLPHRGIAAEFARRIAAHGLSEKQAIVLSHKRDVARQALGLAASQGASSLVGRFAEAVSVFRSASSSPRERERAMMSVVKIILRLTDQSVDDEPAAKTIRRLDLNERVLRRQAIHALTAVPNAGVNTDAGRVAWLASCKSAFEQLNLEMASGKSLGKSFAKPKTHSWMDRLAAGTTSNALAHGTVHEAKGREYQSVCMVLQANRAPHNRLDQLVAAWEGKTEDEAKRVVYVGVTRAAQFLAIAIPESHSARIEAILQKASCAFESVVVEDPDVMAAVTS